MAKPPDINVQASFPSLQSIHLPKESINNSSQLENPQHPQMATRNFSAVNLSPAMDKSTAINNQVLLANIIPTSTTSGSQQFTNFGNQFDQNQNSAKSYARAVRSSLPSFNGVKGVLGYDRLPPRRKIKADNKPAVLFSNLELFAANEKLRHSMILKFSSGRPTLQQIHDHIKMHWCLNGDFVVSLIDPRHVGVYIGNEEDLKLALSKESHIINKCMYRAFRWTPDFDLKIENPIVAVWLRLPGIPWPFYNGALLECIGNEIGRFLRVDNRTLGLTNQLYARLCVEVDVSRPLENEIWIGESKDNGFWQKILYEGNIAYCSNCGLLENEIWTYLTCMCSLPKLVEPLKNLCMGLTCNII